MKKLCCIMGVILLMMSVFAGCTPEEEKVYDEAFLNDFKKGLMARWDQASGDNSADRSTLEALINLELDRLNEYSDKKFEDTQLQQDAITYINLLKKQKEALTYYSGDITKYTELWDEAYSARAQLITQLIDKYELKFPDKYNETIEGFMSTAKVAHEKAEMDKKIEEMEKSITFNLVKTEYSWSHYEAVVENITDKTFGSFSADINLLDEEGIIIDTQYASVSNFAPGQKAKLEFMTDKTFAKYDVKIKYFD